MTTTDRPANRLINETSPYLLQHAYNPVDWYPWGDEAFAAANEQGKPVFLSVGYSACHWCHVMEHESFESEQIAKLMNDWFINIKVDREERPDVDQIYMTAVQLITQRGGWPMSVFLTPDKRPFYGGTYWPPASRMGMPGFAQVLTQIHEAWTTRPQDVEKSANDLKSAIHELGNPELPTSPLNQDLMTNAAHKLNRATDKTFGGFGHAPKFPHCMDLRVQLRNWKRGGDEESLKMCCLTLDKMAAGGIYDHLGGGFARYSTDQKWLVPHFEKMLYDNAQLVTVYLEAFQATGNEQYRRVVEETLTYIQRDLTDSRGAFYSTEDADSEGVEGKFYVWTDEEVKSLLGDDASVFMHCYDVSPGGNWEGNSILNRLRTDTEHARELNLEESELKDILARCKAKLFEHREQRIRPGRDEKILVSWNGLMISAFAQAGRILDQPGYTNRAKQAVDFLLSHLWNVEGNQRLLHSYKDGRARFNGYLDDYACLIEGLLELYQSGFEPAYLESASQLADVMIEQFHDVEGGGFFYTSSDHEELITRNKDLQDNATPAGNNVAATVLLKLGRLVGNTKYEELGYETLERLAPLMEKQAMAFGQALVATDFALGPAHEFVIAPGSDPAAVDTLLREFHKTFRPNDLIILADEANRRDPLLSSVLEGKEAVDGQLTLYVCQRGACQQPRVGLEATMQALQ